MTGPLVVVGDALLDRDVDGDANRLAPDAPVPVLDEAAARSRPGGAGLAAALAALDGRDVVLVTALGADDAGRELAGLLASAGVSVTDLGLAGPTPEKVRLLANGRPLLRLDRGATVSPPGAWTHEAAAAVRNASAVLVSDYGRGLAGHPELRDALSGTGAPVVWDPHPRGAEPVPGARAVTPNAAELLGHAPGRATLAELTTGGRLAQRRWRCAAVVVTRGADGCLLIDGDAPPLVVPARTVDGGDPCGAGDRFAATLAGSLAAGSILGDAVVAATVAATAQVAAGGPPDFSGTAPSRPRPVPDTKVVSRGDAARLASEWRTAGLTVTVAGGCFDMLHAGHVALLQSAASLADVLVVAVNSDRSVRELKGAGRPVVPEADRMAVLAALACVDAVTLFDEDSPAELLRGLRPHLFVKGGDYGHRPLPEEAILAEWGGQAVIVPYLDGRSTTGLLSRAAAS